jgi:hypothetical protein
MWEGAFLFSLQMELVEGKALVSKLSDCRKACTENHHTNN